MVKKDFKRLSKSVAPSNYQITIHPNLETFTFTGSEIIDIEVKRATKRITVNCVDIDVSEALFKNENQAVKCQDIVYDKDAETVVFNFTNEVPVGKAQLELKFTGELNDKMKGFYRSKYTSESGDERYMAVTQFEATDARRAFPCWDEPAIKATFDITLIAPKDRVVLSNMDVREEKEYEEDALQKVVSFNKSPLMSTYLVAFVVGEFEYIEDTSSDNVLVRVYTPCGKTDQGQFALDISLKTLPFYSEYFGIPYPLPKMDLIAIPDFAAGAMENWGLVTYRETCLLVDAQETSAVSKQYVALMVGHELAHQWFGNLTTMEWWTHLWLNEGFASWIEYLCVDFCCPEFDIWTQFVCADYTRALELDGMSNSHPIEVEVGHPEEVNEIFDAVSYSKGASVIRMLHEYVGENDFKAGLNSYLIAFKYKNGRTEDLWDHLQKVSKKPVGRVMSTWTKKMGYPVISVCDEQINDNQRGLKLSQKKFTADASEDSSNSQWQVPITISTKASGGKKCMDTLLSDPDMHIIMDGCPKDAWVKLNPGQVCFYRIKYSAEMLQRLIPAISSLAPVDRLGLASDMFALAYAGYSATTNFLDLLKGFTEEDNYTVWNDIDGNLSCLGILMQNTDASEQFRKYILKLYKPVADKLGWEPQENEDHLTGMLRALVIRRLGLSGDPDIVEECRRRFEAHVDGAQSIAADLRSAVYSTVSRHGDEKTFDDLVKLYDASTHMEEKNRLVRALGYSSNEDTIKKALDFAISDKVRSSVTVIALVGCTSTLVGRRMTWDFIKSNWDELYKRYEGGFLLSRLIKISTENFVTKADEKDVKDFFSIREVPAAERVIKQSIESIQLNKQWLARDGASIIAWLSRN